LQETEVSAAALWALWLGKDFTIFYLLYCQCRVVDDYCTLSSACTRRSSALHRPRSASRACSLRITWRIVLSMSLTWFAFSTRRRFICHNIKATTTFQSINRSISKNLVQRLIYSFERERLTIKILGLKSIRDR